MKSAICLVLCAGALVGCSSTQAPTFAVTSATMKDRSPDGVVLEFTLDADNPNNEALPLQDVTYDVSLDGKQVFHGVRSAEATLRRYGRQQLTLPACVAAADAAGPLAKYRISGEVVYVVPGAIAQTLFDQEVFRPTANFSGEGTVELVR
ncbi:MAG: LEA type 2 family protein [Planctomycetes bacterium]|nr:LEA type 2 family protein [Planctomycetota bacterium]